MVANSTGKMPYIRRIGPLLKVEWPHCACNPLKKYGNPFSFDFNLSMPIITINRTRQGYARKRILKLAGHFFLGGCNASPL